MRSPGRVCKEQGKAESALLSPYITGSVDFLKIDVEGVEKAILRELYESGKLNKIKEMIVEYHHHVRQNEDDFSIFLKILEESRFGYQIRGITDRPYQRHRFQNIMVYAYRKGGDKNDVPGIAETDTGQR
ncbi:MAG: hypothetical protein BWK80_49305 [Desulfobacteraceae bacterium IS3]|nr:MAG: hypothetical protein BWK80_49305 [Desulfobacteraceae bacterium IS3]